MKEILYSKIKEGLYQLSEDGRVYSNTTKKFMKTREDRDGYETITLKNSNNGSSSFGVHRLKLIVFKPIENMEEMQVNHIDGNKKNNSLENLEWVTVTENLKHAKDTGLNKCLGEGHHNASINESDVIEIIEMIKKNISAREICEKFNCSKQVVSQIRNKRTWTHLTKDIDFSQYEITNTKTYSSEQIEAICKCIVEGLDNNSIMDKVFNERNQKYRTAVSSIRNKKSHIAISNKYW